MNKSSGSGSGNASNAENAPPAKQLTDYETKLLESLRSERRGRLGTAAAPVALAPIPDEPPEAGSAQHLQVSAAPAQTAERSLPPDPATRPPLPAEAPARRYISPEPAAERAPPSAPPARRYAPPRPAARGNWWRLGLILLAAPVVVFLAVFAIASLNFNRNPPQGTEKTAAAKPPPDRSAVPDATQATGGQFAKLVTETGVPDETAGLNVGESLASLETLFTGQASRPNGGEEFRKALLNTAPNSPARLSYLEVTGDRIRLRNNPAETGQVLQTVSSGAYVRVQERSAASGWCQVRVPEGRAGWLKCDFLKPIAEFSPVSKPSGMRKEAAPRQFP